MSWGTLLFCLVLLAFATPAIIVSIALARSARPMRFRYRLMSVLAPVLLLCFGVGSVSNYLQHGFRWKEQFGIVLILAMAWFFWRELPRLRLAAQHETPRWPERVRRPRSSFSWQAALI